MKNFTNEIRIKDLKFQYTDNLGRMNTIIENINLNIELGSVVCFFGPNGCGKSTLLKLLASIIKVKEQSITIFGRKASEIDIGYIPQDFAESLFPWLTNLDNIAFPLYMKGITKNEARLKSRIIALELSESIPLDNYPYESSLGQKQLVSLARALNNSSEVLLADEPFSALDFKNRILLQNIFQKVLAPSNQITSLVVSHQIDDAVFLGDKVVLLSSLPCNILKVFNIPFERPRNQNIKKSREFHDLVNEITDLFLESN
jgi:NitT/TauT family transport system ATP-binding protein